MVDVQIKKIRIELMSVISAVLVVMLIAGTGALSGLRVMAVEMPEVSVSATESVVAGETVSAIVSVDCQDKVFTSGSVKLQMATSSFADVSATGDTDIECKVEQGTEATSITYSFNIADGLRGTVLLGNIKAVATNSTEKNMGASINIVDINFTNNGVDESAAFKITNSVMEIVPLGLATDVPAATEDNGGNEPVATATADANMTATAVATATPGATGDAANSEKGEESVPGATVDDLQDGNGEAEPTATSVTELLTDTAGYTLEEIEDISAGAIVFWSLVSLVAGIWIGIGLGYMFWRKKKSKPQVKDSNRNVIGHLQ